ncbi:MAG: MBL fold metallo-hydrolase [Oscillospiraceae bacterium]|nr:MBL fold metallo-hydrolase [Oscillospiraceae bacterium]
MHKDINYDDAIEIADGVYWVGFPDLSAGFHCNVFIVIDNDEAVVIDSGSRNDFSTVMLKIMRTGTNPKNIKRLIYQHYDPDLCGNIPQMEAIIDNPELEIISHRMNNPFIKFYLVKSPIRCIEEIDHCFEFSSGRRLRFIFTPFCHAPGSFMTYDEKSKTLFSSDIFGAFDHNWSFYSEMSGRCFKCKTPTNCAVTGDKCQWSGMREFHERVMPSIGALDYALTKIEELDISLIAPQHGSMHRGAESVETVIKRLRSLRSVGFDYLIEEDKYL